MADLCVELAAAAQGACRPSPQVIGSSAVADCPPTSAHKPVMTKLKAQTHIYLRVDLQFRDAVPGAKEHEIR
jgi:hypothetical protein